MNTTISTWDEVPLAVKNNLAFIGFLCKQASEPYADPNGYTGVPGLTHLTDALGWQAGPINASWGGPRPVVNMLVGSTLGALSGYGAGRLAENVTPTGLLEPGKPRKRLAYLGALLGGLPGVYQSVDNTLEGTTPFHNWKGASVKYSSDSEFNPFIQKDVLVNALMQDRLTPGYIRASAAGLVEAASATREYSPLVSPWDIARVAMGTGSGVASALILGKTLGALAGLSPEAQKSLKDSGYWAGILKATVPSALNRQGY